MFEDFYKELIDKEAEVMMAKKVDYASEDNRWENFESVALMTGVTREQVALTYLLKHIQSIAKAITEDPNAGMQFYWVKSTGGEGLKQRFVDARNYLALLAGMLEENKGGKNNANNV